MYRNHFVAFAFLITVHLTVKQAAAVFSNGHSKRELSFNNYPATAAPADPREYNYLQRNEVNDPGYTAQHDDKPVLDEKHFNSSNFQNSPESTSPTAQMFHFIYMLPSLHKRQVASVNPNDGFQHINGNAQNLIYAGPHLFPPQLPHLNENSQHFNTPIRNFNAALQNIYSNQQFLRPFHQNFARDPKVTTKMEAPFIPSQFLGYGQQQGELLLQQQQHLLPHNQQPFQDHQQRMQQHQQNQQQQQQQLHLQNLQQQPAPRPAPVYEQPENSPYQQYSRFVYAAPNNILYHGLRNRR